MHLSPLHGSCLHGTEGQLHVHVRLLSCSYTKVHTRCTDQSLFPFHGSRLIGRNLSLDLNFSISARHDKVSGRPREVNSGGFTRRIRNGNRPAVSPQTKSPKHENTPYGTHTYSIQQYSNTIHKHTHTHRPLTQMPNSLLEISPPTTATTTTTTLFMFSATSSSTLTLIASASLLFLAVCMFYPASLLRWLQRKRYQYEVTFSLYMMTPTEKFIFSAYYNLQQRQQPSFPIGIYIYIFLSLPIHLLFSSLSFPFQSSPVLKRQSKTAQKLKQQKINRLNPLPLPEHGHHRRVALPARTHRRHRPQGVLLHCRRLGGHLVAEAGADGCQDCCYCCRAGVFVECGVGVGVGADDGCEGGC